MREEKVVLRLERLMKESGPQLSEGQNATSLHWPIPSLDSQHVVCGSAGLLPLIRRRRPYSAATATTSSLRSVGSATMPGDPPRWAGEVCVRQNEALDVPSWHHAQLHCFTESREVLRTAATRYEIKVAQYLPG